MQAQYGRLVAIDGDLEDKVSPWALWRYTASKLTPPPWQVYENQFSAAETGEGDDEPLATGDAEPVAGTSRYGPGEELSSSDDSDMFEY